VRAVYLEKAGEALKVIDRPEPELRSGGALVRILAAPVLSFMNRVSQGNWGTRWEPPGYPALTESALSKT
jgi:alcohol dehydrogenase